MQKANLILGTSLFKEDNLRELLRKFIESQLTSEFNETIDLTNLDSSLILKKDSSLKGEIALVIRNAKIYINFIHDASDKIFQNLIFLFLIYSYSKFPDKQSWINFLNEKEEDKSKIIQNGITEVWVRLQSDSIFPKLNGEIERSISESDDLPF
jgi:hypothetical protein